MDSNKYGVITEQNDLGLGFNFLSEKDQKDYQEIVDTNNSSKENEN